MQPSMLVPSFNEQDYCHFCFGGVNVHSLFSLGRPDLLSIIDNIIGIHLTPEADEKFSLCDNCIKTMETFVTFRNKSRSNYETVREAKIMNEAMKRLQPLLQVDLTNSMVSIASASIASNQLNQTNKAQAPLNVTVDAASSPLLPIEQTMTKLDGCSSLRKRSLHKLNNSLEASAKKSRIEKATKDRNRFSHIRELMNRFRISLVREKDMCNGELNSSENNAKHRDGITNGQTSSVKQAEKSQGTICKPCLVVVKKLVMVKQ